MPEYPPTELASDYYVTHFFQISDFVVQTYRDLLTPAELDWFSSLRVASDDAQRLYIRLLSRRGSIYRLNRLNYAEICDIRLASSELTRRNLAHCELPQRLSNLLTAFTKPEILQILDLHDRRGQSRIDLVQHIESADLSVQQEYRRRLQSAEHWITIKGYQHWMLFQLCFFGNLYQDSSLLTLDQLGTIKYAEYSIDRTSRAFTSRKQIEAHWRYFECESLYECCSKSDKESLLRLLYSLPDDITFDVTLRRRVDRIRNRIARQLERLSCFDIAQQQYQQSVHPPARERRVRLLLMQQAWSDATTLAKQMSEQPFNETERLVAMRLLARCYKAQGIAHTKPRTFKPFASKLVLSSTDLRVEEAARRYYAKRGACFYVENALVTGVLGLFIWDIIFHSIPGVFFNRYQVAPADFFEAEFYLRRRELIGQRFLELEDKARFSQRLITAFETYHGNVNPLVHWQRLSPELLSLAVERVSATQWSAMFIRILTDTREHRNGLPDLVFFPHNGGYEFIEIKGPGDSLQANQRRWMQFFNEHKIDYRLVNVSFYDSDLASTGLTEKNDQVVG